MRWRKVAFLSATGTRRIVWPRYWMPWWSGISQSMAWGSLLWGATAGFDALAASAVKRAKNRHPDVRLVCLRPYHPAERPEKTPSGFDGSFYPPGMERVPRKLAIVRANRYMVDNSDFLIAYAWHPGNARELVEYAQRREWRGLLRVEVLGQP